MLNKVVRVFPPGIKALASTWAAKLAGLADV
jgi:hypothetical protein